MTFPAIRGETAPDLRHHNPAPQCTLEIHRKRGGSTILADTTNEKLYKAEYVGSGTFLISKPKRKKTKQRQSNLKNVRRGSRK